MQAMRWTMGAAAALMLAGCDQPAEPENAAMNTAPAETANYVAEVMALGEDQRLSVMFRAIRDAGLPCQQVKSAEIEPKMSPTTWRAVCEDGRNHLVAIEPSGDATVMSGR